jgi:ATP-dependent DNA helicase RecG
MLKIANGEMSRRKLQLALGLKHAEHFRKSYLLPALRNRYIEMTIPKQPRSQLQRYRLTEKGKRWLWMRDREE